MHIDSISLYHVALPRKRPKVIAGRTCETLESVLVQMKSGGAVGWGEASPGNAPHRNSEWAAGAFALLRDWFAARIVNTEIESGETLVERLLPFQGNQYAKAALDIAWWELSARMQNRPLYELLKAELPSPPAPLPGGEGRSSVEVGACFDQMESPDEFVQAIGAAFAAGFQRVKLKIRPGWAVEMLRGVRQEFPSERFHVDCEGALHLGQMEMLHRFGDFSLEMLEQPLAPDDLVAHAMLQESVRTPICLDESIRSALHADLAIDLKSCRVMNLKAERVGGLTTALEILAACRAAEIDCWGGAEAQSAIGARADLALAACTGSAYPADFFTSRDELAEDLAEPLCPRRDADGREMRIGLPVEAGLGVVPDVKLLERFTLQKAEL